ncbi:MAG: 16S rRNA (guanine(966)-N(2))-methyltransferase RsmD [Tenericutes bacterium GWC2_34_14]|nr:MAG: 16S rRNA (guanine(966)-N(2))-methyltransferase RsmD [Tenericutes bacterium GWA2_35_7]OHE29486.1 MAG: 16S rRNA (guanine(966)-N(2))-methyltransferase RsmD [Tenericutes bacterium GWC2_34_14]OHE34582.1 MAG: 16S rRNA (guanine(966)-N(2))-methyltransferase RsmD [Tenericutes bacterium GWE2_34_108]OHE35939.1 MAG: 16S rRNA (guanine(966)-N(2))-methyltransferase RsmD [Tenericutes bacterium GWF1_35_14]OHE38975.1 MAG: 16S rRNA (guanine(966)-N(2))-methyltransferase RsmD [Tenericutes bacterium GWF2_35_
MRIVGGKHRGRQLKRVEKQTTRETADMVKVAVFNMLLSHMDGTVLDLFAGSGAYGIEAISRGVKHAIFVDHDKDACLTIKHNVEMIGETDASTIYNMSYETFLKTKLEGYTFDVVFLDPPYALNVYEDVISMLEPYINDSGVVVCESDKKLDLPEQIKSLHQIKEKMYGIKKITIYQK